MNEKPNQIRLSGSARMTVGALAIGDHAKAVNRVINDRLGRPDESEVAARLAELVEQLRTHAGELPNSDELLSTTETVAGELAKDKPNRTAVRGLLSALAADSQAVSGVAAAVSAVAEAVNALFG